MAGEKVAIKVTQYGDNDYEPVGVSVSIAGEEIGGGGIGGEPEDNCMVRDYSWIVPTLKRLAERLGGEVSIERAKENPDADEEG